MKTMAGMSQKFIILMFRFIKNLCTQWRRQMIFTYFSLAIETNQFSTSSFLKFIFVILNSSLFFEIYSKAVTNSKYKISPNVPTR